MEVFRLSKSKYASPLSGAGAALKGARWNSVGTELIYTSANRSLAMAEVAVHFTLATMPSDYMIETIYFPDGISMQTIKQSDLPKDWAVFPHSNSTKKFGDGFVLANYFCLLKVPSAVTKGDFNYLINPRHPEFSRIKIINIEPFPFDSRIFK